MPLRVPFARPLYGPDHPKGPTRGVDVVAVKRALARAGFLSWRNFDRVYNRRTVRAVQELQRRAGIQPSGHYGFPTHEALRLSRRQGSDHEWAFDAYGVHLIRKRIKEDAKTELEVAQEAIADACAFWIAHRGEIGYAQIRPFPVVDPPTIIRRTDCSGFVTTVIYAAGGPDPNGRGYDGFGYTGTLVSRGVRVGVVDLRVGDLVFYGRTTNPSPAFPVGSPTHVAIAIGGGYVASHGSEPGPMKLDADYRSVHSVRRYDLI